MLRELLLYLSHSKSLRAIVTHFPIARNVSARFVAGEKIEDAIRVMRELYAKKMTTTMDHLGENVSTAAEAARATDDYLRLLDEIAAANLPSHVSLKLTQFGLDLGEEIALSNLRRVLDKAKAMKTFVRVDMEDTSYTDRTLKIVRAAKDLGYDNLGTVIQSYLYRSEEDVRALCNTGIRIRLCKGAYQEPADKAFPLKKDVDANYVKLAQIMLDAAATNPDLYPAFATHDENMIAPIKEYAAQKNIPRLSFEFQMLHGIRSELQYALAAEGYNFRVYVPYGTEWYPYFMRRLAERPANLWFFVSNFFRR